MKRKQILKLLREIKNSYHLNPTIYTQGSCFRLYCILKSAARKSKPYYSNIDGRWVTKIKGRYYDINGEIAKRYIKNKEYKHITDKMMLASVYTYANIRRAMRELQIHKFSSLTNYFYFKYILVSLLIENVCERL